MTFSISFYPYGLALQALWGTSSKRYTTVYLAWISSRLSCNDESLFSRYHREISREGLFLPLCASRFVRTARRQQDALEASKSFRVYAHEITRDSRPQVLGISYMAANVVVSYLRCCSKCEIRETFPVSPPRGFYLSFSYRCRARARERNVLRCAFRSTESLRIIKNYMQNIFTLNAI